MPIRDFKCDECGKIEERLCKTEQTVIQCRQCSGEAKAQLSAPKHIRFKGTGFYETDYKGK